MSNIPTRLLILQRLQALLEGPLVFKEQPLPMEGKVFRGRNILGDESAGQSLSILEAPRPDFAYFAGEEKMMRKDKLTLLIQGRTPDDKLNPCDNAYYLCAAVEERLNRVIAERSAGRDGGLYPEHYLLGNLITDMEVAPPVVRPPEDKVSSSAFFFLAVRVGIAGEIGRPYTQVL